MPVLTEEGIMYVDGFVVPVPKKKVDANVMKDPRIAAMGKDMPFDGKRMIYGGFKKLVEG